MTADTQTKNRRRIVKAYPYTAETGNLLYEVVRYEPKDFRTRVALGGGKFVWKLDGVRKVLYRLHLIHELFDQVVFVCEGEKDADNVAAAGLHSTTCQGSVNGWLPEFALSLKLNKVVILPHNDETGRKFAAKVIASIDSVVQDWRVLELEGLAEKGDVSDWLAAGNDGLTLYRKALWMLECPNPRKPAQGPATNGKPSPAAAEIDTPWRFECIDLASIKPEPIEWLWEPLWMDHTLNLLVGPPGAGKTFVACHLAATVSRGSKWPDSEGHAPIGNVVYMTTENNMAQSLVPRLIAAGADMTKLKTWTRKTRRNRLGELVTEDISLEDVDAMMDALDASPELRLVILDPVTAYIGEKEPNDNKEVRRILEKAMQVAQEKRICIVMLSHIKKSLTSAINAAMGAAAWTQVPRSVNVQFKDPDYIENRRRSIVAIKNNEGDDTFGKRFRVVPIPGDERRASISWDAEKEHRSADDILSELNARCGNAGRETSSQNASDKRQTQLLGVLDKMTPKGEGWVPAARVREALGWNGAKMKAVLWEMTDQQLLEERWSDKTLPNDAIEAGGLHEIRRVRFDVLK